MLRETYRDVRPGDRVGYHVPPRPAFGAECEAAWYILAVASTREMAMCRLVEELGALQGWCPTEPVWRSRAYRPDPELVHMPIAPGYVFLLTGNVVDWRVLRDRSMGRIRGVIGRDGVPLPISPRVMAQMSAVPDRVLAQKRAAAEAARVRPGDQAVIGAGPFEGFVVDVEDLTGPIARVVVSLFGRMTEVQVEVGTLSRVGADGMSVQAPAPVRPVAACLTRVRALLDAAQPVAA